MLAARVPAQVPLPDAKPVPRVQATPLPYDQASIQVNGEELTRYHFGPGLRRPFHFPVVGPSGRSLTRMGHPHDPVTHSHHNSVWISHHDVSGDCFWDDRGPGRIVHRAGLPLDDGDDAAPVIALNDWSSAGDRVLLVERRRMTVRPVGGRLHVIDLDLQFGPRAGSTTLGKTPFGLVGSGWRRRSACTTAAA